MAKFKKHPIQIAALHVSELYIKVNNSSAFDEHDEYRGKFGLEVGTTDFDEHEDIIQVKMRATIGINEDQTHDHESPINLSVELHGTFEVDVDNFPMDKIDHWAEHNAPFIIYPYLREHVMGLTTRAGIPGLLLPLFEVPLFRVTQKAPE